MKTIDIRNLSIEEIQDKIEAEKLAYQNTKVGHKVSGIENPIQIRGMRRNIARLATILTEKQNSSK